MRNVICAAPCVQKAALIKLNRIKMTTSGLFGSLAGDATFFMHHLGHSGVCD